MIRSFYCELATEHKGKLPPKVPHIVLQGSVWGRQAALRQRTDEMI